MERDIDVVKMTEEELREEILKWRSLVRQHRDQKGHDRCWFDDLELYKNLPEGIPENIQAVFELPNWEEWQSACAIFCRNYWETRQDSEWKK